MTLASMALRSAWNRRYTLVWMVLAVALSTALLLGVERVRSEARNAFAQSVSGADLIVGARTSPIQLLMYAVFHVGAVQHDMSWASVQRLREHPQVDWVIPLSLGDSMRGFAVLGTTAAYYQHYRYGDARPLAFAQGQATDGLFDAVLGADVARDLGYRVGDRITLAHGHGDAHDHHEGHGHDDDEAPAHADKPFTVTGILARTGTPVDRTVHVSLQAIEAIHLDWQAGAPIPGLHIPPQFVRKFDLSPKHVTGALVGLKLRSRVFEVQRDIAADPREPLIAVMPGVVLDELWDVVGQGEKALLAVSAMVMLVGLAGLVSTILAALSERRRELAILRAVGARPLDVLWLLALEGMIVMVLGIAGGYLLLTGAALAFGDLTAAWLGIPLGVAGPQRGELGMLGAILGAGVLASLLPAWRAYRMSLADGLLPNT
ncbi:ABC transporter permease [Cupriavidus agavae]|uniref:Putative ABC transport system permease protein n=1 Tax=Cupriavidus agavae TaxID=1001822 RepID=A0A4Q7S1F1_9BURK|nr:ABC transporter permease [Cupriavidus agavae]RZT39407.1 putative ABC transport system permease protein [Cupriavidus agavae]